MRYSRYYIFYIWLLGQEIALINWMFQSDYTNEMPLHRDSHLWWWALGFIFLGSEAKDAFARLRPEDKPEGAFLKVNYFRSSLDFFMALCVLFTMDYLLMNTFSPLLK